MTAYNGTCKACDKPFEFEAGFDLPDTATCPHCGAVHELDYDESWNGEDEWYWWTLGALVPQAQK